MKLWLTVIEWTLLFFCLPKRKVTKEKAARTLPLYPLLAALPRTCPSGPRCSCTSARDNSLQIFLGRYQFDVTKFKSLSAVVRWHQR
jgi:hypothetical protein